MATCAAFAAETAWANVAVSFADEPSVSSTIAWWLRAVRERLGGHLHAAVDGGAGGPPVASWPRPVTTELELAGSAVKTYGLAPNP